MGLLDRARDFAVKAYNYVVGNDNESKSASNAGKSTASSSKSAKSSNASKTNAQQKINSIQNPKGDTVDKVGDTLEMSKKTIAAAASQSKKTVDNVSKKSNASSSQSNNKKSGAKTAIQKSIDNVLAKIQQKCAKFGISYEEAQKSILSQLQFSYEDYKLLSPEEQLSVLLCIDGALGLYIIDQGKRKVHKDVDKAALIGQTAKNIAEAKESGAIDDISEYGEMVGDINKELEGKVSEDTTDEELAQLLVESKKSLQASIELERLAEIRKCHGNKKQIDEINKKFEARLHSFEEQRQIDFVAANGPQKARFSIYLRGADDYAEAHRTALTIFSGYQRTIVADSFNHDFEMDARRVFHESGDPVSADKYAEALTYTTQYMSEDALNKFQKDAYEFRLKVQNGEIDAPYMSEEDFTKETVAIGVGITNNKNMSSSAKAELLNKWDENAQQFSDYIYVKEQYNKSAYNSVSGNPNELQGFINVKKILQERYNNNIEQFPRAWEKRTQNNNTEKPKANEATLKNELKTKTVSEIKSCYNNSMQEIVKIVLENDVAYKNRLDDILDYLKCFSGTDIGIKIAGCSTPTISKIILSFPEKADDILDVVAPTMCFTGKQAVERIVDEGKKNEAA